MWSGHIFTRSFWGVKVSLWIRGVQVSRSKIGEAYKVHSIGWFPLFYKIDVRDNVYMRLDDE